METPVCQSCGMELKSSSDFGTNADGSVAELYCCYCYKNGKFTSDCTMDEMIERCAQNVEEFNKESNTSYSKEEAIAEMKSCFPRLKRWENENTQDIRE